MEARRKEWADSMSHPTVGSRRSKTVRLFQIFQRCRVAPGRANEGPSHVAECTGHPLRRESYSGPSEERTDKQPDKRPIFPRRCKLTILIRDPNMAKRKSSKSKSTGNGHALVIVESPAKARTIGKFLGSGLHGRGEHRPRPRPAAGRQADSGPIQGRAVVEPGRQRQRQLHADLHRSAGQEQADQAAQGPAQRRPTPSIWRRTRTAKARPSVGTCWRCSSRRCRSIGSCFTKSRKDAIQAALAVAARRRRRPGAGPGNAPHSRSAVSATKCRRCCGARCGRSSRPAACRASPCG